MIIVQKRDAYIIDVYIWQISVEICSDLLYNAKDNPERERRDVGQ